MRACQEISTDSVWLGYQLGNTIPTSNITAGGSATFASYVETSDKLQIKTTGLSGGTAAIYAYQDGGNPFFTVSQNGGVKIGGNAALNVDSANISLNADGSATFAGGDVNIDSDGGVNIGTSSNPFTGSQLQVNTDAGSYFVTSYGHLLLQNKNASTTDWWSLAPRNDGRLILGNGAPDANGVVSDEKFVFNGDGSATFAQDKIYLNANGSGRFKSHLRVDSYIQVFRDDGNESVLTGYAGGAIGVNIAAKGTAKFEGTVTATGFSLENVPELS